MKWKQLYKRYKGHFTTGRWVKRHQLTRTCRGQSHSIGNVLSVRKQEHDFMKEIVELIKIKFPYAEVKYEKMEFTGSHVIRVYPQSLYNSSEFLKLNAEIYMQYQKLESPNDFGMVSEDSII